MKILHLTLTRKWFDLIASGKKTEEYREGKPYWFKRLAVDNNVGKEFDIVRFTNGYGKHRPTMDVEFRGVSFTTPELYETNNGEVLWDDTIVIALGRVLKTENY